MGKSIQLGRLQNSEGRVQMCLQSSSSLMSPDAKQCFNIKKNLRTKQYENTPSC